MSGPGQGANYGIVGPVTAKAVAVGPHARASVVEDHAASREAFDGALEALHRQIAALQLSEPSKQLLSADVTKMREMPNETPAHQAAASGVLTSLIDKLKMIGVVLQTSEALLEPVKKIAEWFGVPIPF